jgi:CDP-diacylglycerol--serine O-phosphatidyltransferase
MKPYGARRQYRKKGQRINTLKKGVYILPNLLTSLGLLCGFYSIIAAMRGSFVKAAWAIVIAGLFDGLDGRIARLTHTTTKFGLEYDSLSDLVAFGVAPALLAYGLVLNQYGRWGWLAAFLFVACGAMRLARFNTIVNTHKTNYFLGLPIPVAAGMVAVTILFCFYCNIADTQLLSIFLLLSLYVEALLMVSTIRYRSFKNVDLRSKRPLNSVFIFILLICIIAAEPQVTLFAIGLVYVFSGPIEYIGYLVRRKKFEETPVLQSEVTDGQKFDKG